MSTNLLNTMAASAITLLLFAPEVAAQVPALAVVPPDAIEVDGAVDHGDDLDLGLLGLIGLLGLGGLVRRNQRGNA